ncbi:sensor histidine kinase [Oligoflexus tunisiensis]|uniref:sensor histidine kinase n=1 Tax=Oligoflexus tunisiensis TaxID=708132 RepID=UPI00159F2CB1|nr:HAMP domain-containing sensor histidine kinase [Oligoflexus tunisiensis]
MKQIFIAEARENLQQCQDYLEQLRTAVDGTSIRQALLLLADNLCEPALMVGLPEVFEVAQKFRHILASQPASEPITPDNLQKLKHHCHVLQNMLGAEAGFSTLSAKDILAHDLKSPLGIIKATVENLLHTAPAENAGALQRILRQANKGLQLLGHWLQDDALQAAHRERRQLSVRELIKECCEALQVLAAQKQIRMQLKVDAALTVTAHALYLSQILQNLLGNAIKFSAVGGQIEIRAEKSKLPGSEVPAVLFQIVDQGRGIEEQHLPYIFMQRTQTKAQDRQHGSGLGLAICKNLCEWHGGTIWVRSRPRKGSTFCFVIPDG